MSSFKEEPHTPNHSVTRIKEIENSTSDTNLFNCRESPFKTWKRIGCKSALFTDDSRCDFTVQRNGMHWVQLIKKFPFIAICNVRSVHFLPETLHHHIDCCIGIESKGMHQSKLCHLANPKGSITSLRRILIRFALINSETIPIII